TSKHFIFFLFLSGLLCDASGQDTLNPLKGDIRAHDPVMIKEGDTYYVFHTGLGIGVKTSKDRITWKRDSSVFSPNAMPAWFKNDIPEQKGDLWAPDIHFRDSKYHLYYSVSAWMNFNSSIGYATNITLDRNSPNYKWEDQGQVISYKNGGEGVNVIDPNVFVDKDGKVWLIYGSYKAGLRMAELDGKTGKLKSEMPQLFTITTSLGEGVFIIKGPEYYYIFASRGRCCAGMESTYQIVMGRSKNVTGPYLNKEGKSWVDNNYSLFLAGDSTAPGKGHNGFFTERDTTFIVYHAYTRAANGVPLLNIKPLYIDEQGWPTLDASKKLFRREMYK
ncbi:MAG: arabinan endo-1,5-alpha-L-arabinosidase, partial [Flavisolibacter sp.]|nr:arabinan endo-1,5-alpha-L-arabinosidase [Flavisolibacter sp.]